MRTLFTFFVFSLVASQLTAQAITFTSSCETITTCSFEADCGPAFAELIAEATTTCPAGIVTYSYAIDLDNDGSVNQSGSLADASGNFPLGTHKITFTASDDCSNTETCEILFTLKDCVPPEVVVFSGLAFDLENDGEFELFANVFNNGSSDNCGIQTFLMNSPSMGPGQTEPPASAGSSILFTCNDLGTQTLDFWAGDADGNWSYFSTYVLVQDNLGACLSDPSFELCLYAETECGNLIGGVDYGISQLPGIPDIIQCTTFNAIDTPLPLTITPVKDNDPLNGVSTFDLIFIVKHILGQQLLDSPYKLIAADVNNTGNITALDLVHLRQLILGAIQAFPNNTSWRFVDKDFVFPDPQDPWATSFPSICTINSYQDISKTFIGMKTGDVSSNQLPCDSLWNSEAEDRNTGAHFFDIENFSFAAGEKVSVPFKANDFKNIAGYQFALHFDPEALVFSGFEKGNLKDLEAFNFNFNQMENGIIKSSWVDPEQQSEDFSGQTLFYLNFTALKAGQISDFLEISQDEFASEIYTNNLEIKELQLKFDSKLESRLLSNQPNPFRESTNITFQLTERQNVGLVIYDIKGKAVKAMQIEAEKGINKIVLPAEDFPNPGIYFYQLKNQNATFTRKMIKQ